MKLERKLFGPGTEYTTKQVGKSEGEYSLRVYRAKLACSFHLIDNFVEVCETKIRNLMTNLFTRRN